MFTVVIVADIAGANTCTFIATIASIVVKPCWLSMADCAPITHALSHEVLPSCLGMIGAQSTIEEQPCLIDMFMIMFINKYLNVWYWNSLMFMFNSMNPSIINVYYDYALSTFPAVTCYRGASLRGSCPLATWAPMGFSAGSGGTAGSMGRWSVHP